MVLQGEMSQSEEVREGEKMLRPVIEWKDTQETDYLKIVDDCTALIKCIVEFQKTMITKAMVEKEGDQ